MRNRLGSYVMAVVVAILATVTVAAPAQAAVQTFTIQNVGSNWCLDGLPDLTLTLVTNSNEADRADHNLCKDQLGDTTYLWTVNQVSSNDCVRSYCGEAYTIHPYLDHGYCLSQNNAKSAYLTSCSTSSDYQRWIFWNSSGEIPGIVLTYMISEGSIYSGSTWCLSSNLTPPDGYPSGYGSVYSTGISILGYHQWFFLPEAPEL